MLNTAYDALERGTCKVLTLNRTQIKKLPGGPGSEWSINVFLSCVEDDSG
jgi:hypothetical protein